MDKCLIVVESVINHFNLNYKQDKLLKGGI